MLHYGFVTDVLNAPWIIYWLNLPIIIVLGKFFVVKGFTSSSTTFQFTDELSMERCTNWTSVKFLHGLRMLSKVSVHLDDLGISEIGNHILHLHISSVPVSNINIHLVLLQYRVSYFHQMTKSKMVNYWYI